MINLTYICAQLSRNKVTAASSVSPTGGHATPRNPGVVLRAMRTVVSRFLSFWDPPPPPHSTNHLHIPKNNWQTHWSGPKQSHSKENEWSGSTEETSTKPPFNISCHFCNTLLTSTNILNRLCKTREEQDKENPDIQPY